MLPNLISGSTLNNQNDYDANHNEYDDDELFLSTLDDLEFFHKHKKKDEIDKLLKAEDTLEQQQKPSIASDKEDDGNLKNSNKCNSEESILNDLAESYFPSIETIASAVTSSSSLSYQTPLETQRNKNNVGI